MNTPVREGKTIEGSRTMRNRPYPVLKCSSRCAAAREPDLGAGRLSFLSDEPANSFSSRVSSPSLTVLHLLFFFSPIHQPHIPGSYGPRILLLGTLLRAPLLPAVLSSLSTQASAPAASADDDGDSHGRRRALAHRPCRRSARAEDAAHLRQPRAAEDPQRGEPHTHLPSRGVGPSSPPRPGALSSASLAPRADPARARTWRH